MVQTFSDNNKIYSVDMMFAYINIYKPKYQNIKIKSLLRTLEYRGWGDPQQNIYYSPLDVLKDPKNIKYKNEITRIKNADLKFPIIVGNNFVVDGVHRLTKAYLNGKKTIKAYIFTNTDMNNFLINKSGNWDKVNKLKIYDYIQLFHERFTNFP